jgi:hypothetical protein
VFGNSDNSGSPLLWSSLMDLVNLITISKFHWITIVKARKISVTPSNSIMLSGVKLETQKLRRLSEGKEHCVFQN